MGLLQKEVAERIGVNGTSIYNWENNRKKPALRFVPKIIEFLGYVPADEESGSIGERIVAYRRVMGMIQKRLAQKLDVDPTTPGKWEREKGEPKGCVFEVMEPSGASLDTE